MRATLDEVAWASPWRSRSIAERVALTFGLGLWGLLAPTWWVAIAILVIVLALAFAVAKVSPRTYLIALSAPWVFILIGAVAVAVGFGHGDGALVTFGPFQITSDSLAAAGMIISRAFAVTAAVMLLAATCPMTELLSGMRRLGVPGVLVDIAAAMYRMIFLLLGRASEIKHAQTARLGYSTRKGAIRSMGQLLATVFISALGRARRLEAGLEGRGGTGELVAVRPPNPPSAVFVTGTIVVNAAAASLVFLGWWFR